MIMMTPYIDLNARSIDNLFNTLQLQLRLHLRSTALRLLRFTRVDASHSSAELYIAHKP